MKEICELCKEEVKESEMRYSKRNKVWHVKCLNMLKTPPMRLNKGEKNG